MPANIGCNRDDSHCHGFVEHYCDSFTRRGQEQEIGGCQRLAHPLWGKRPGQLNIAQHWIAQHTFQHRTFRTFADDQRTERNTALRNIAQDSHRQARSLFWCETPDGEDQGQIERDAKRLADGRTVKVRRIPHVHINGCRADDDPDRRRARSSSRADRPTP